LPHTRTDGAPFAYHLGWSGHEASSSSLTAARATFSDLGRELERMPSLRLRETGLPGSSSFVSIRGSAPAQVAVAIGGAGTTGPSPEEEDNNVTARRGRGGAAASASPKYSVLLPTYNERENIGLIVWRLVKSVEEK
jgi:hypothetical protein